MNSQVHERSCRPDVSTDHRGPAKELQLDSMQARRWLDYLESLASGSEHAHTLADFCNKLDDALWLARWKREYVVMEFELADVASLIAAVSGQEPGVLADHGLDIQEDILATLAKMSGWT